MMKKRAGKNNRGGFTLAETLVAVLILMMVSSVIAAGIPAAANALTNAEDASHSQVLISTTMTSLRDELSMALDISFDEDNKKIFYTDAFGAKCVLEAVDGDGIHLEKVARPDGTVGQPATAYSGLLVSQEAATEGLYSTFTKATMVNGVVVIEGLRVCKQGHGSGDSDGDAESGDQVLADFGDVAFLIEVISEFG